MPIWRQGEAHEHPDGVQRNEQCRDAAEVHEQARGNAGQEHDAPAVGEPVAAEAELAGHVVVLGQDRGQTREGVEDVLAARNRMSAVASWKA